MTSEAATEFIFEHLYEDIFQDHQGNYWGFKIDSLQMRQVYLMSDLEPYQYKLYTKNMPVQELSLIERYLKGRMQTLLLSGVAVYSIYEGIPSLLGQEWTEALILVVLIPLLNLLAFGIQYQNRRYRRLEQGVKRQYLKEMKLNQSLIQSLEEDADYLPS